MLPLCSTSFLIFKRLYFSNERSRLVLDLIFEIIEALKFLHGLGIVHGDIKEENILIKERDGRCFALVTDFGSCRLKNISYDRNDGTIPYLPPEFFKPSLLLCQKFGIEESSILRYNNFQMDYWSLGVLMYFIMTGRYPFIDEDGRPTRVPHEWIMWCYGPGNKMGPKEPLFNHDETGKKIKSTLPMVHTPRIDITIPENRVMMKMLYGFLSPQPFYRWCSRQANNIKQELPVFDKDIDAAHASFLAEIKSLPEYLQP
jgi:serine/threonine protein kinase